MKTNFKILILEDNQFDAQLTLRELKKSSLNFVSKEVDNKNGYISAIDEFKPNVILSDHSLPSIYSREALSIAREKCPECIFILITGTVSEEFAVDILKEGADDYLLKSSLTRLPSAIMNSFDKKQAEKERAISFIKLEEANQELKTFIYRASHDLRGPLSSLRGLINIIKEDTKEKKTSSLINMMYDSTNKLDNTLAELINTVRVRDQKVVITELFLTELINEIIEQLKFLNGFENIHFKINSDDNHALYSDKNLVISIMQNIIKNAINYQNHSHPQSFINIDIKSTNEGKIITVKDNGVGIKKDLQKKVFEMFFRANLISEGTGLGLYLVRNSVEKLGGHVVIESEEKMGTAVTVFIPSKKT